MKLYVLIEKGGCYTDYYSEIKHVSSKKKEALAVGNELLKNYKKSDFIQSLYIDIWENGKQLENATIQLYEK